MEANGLLALVFLIIIVGFTYLLIKTAVKNGVLEAYDVIEERKKQNDSEEESDQRRMPPVVPNSKPKTYKDDSFYYDGVDGDIKAHDFDPDNEKSDSEDKPE